MYCSNFTIICKHSLFKGISDLKYKHYREETFTNCASTYAIFCEEMGDVRTKINNGKD